MRPILTITEVARRMGVSRKTIRIYEQEGFIRLERVSGRCVLPQSEVESIARIERLRKDLGVNIAGIGVILQMRERMQEMQKEIARMEEEMERRLRQAVDQVKMELERPLSHSADRSVSTLGDRSLSKIGDRSIVKVEIIEED